MAEQTAGSRSGVTIGLIAATLVAIVGFMWWLGANAEPSSVAVVEPDSAAEGSGPALAGTQVDLAALAASPENYTGQQVQMQGLEVASMLGAQAFWVNPPNNVPFLIKIDDQAAGTQIPVGGAVDLSGTVHMMSDSVLTSWEERGAIEGTQRDEASFATAFVQASAIRVARQAAAPAQEPQQ